MSESNHLSDLCYHSTMQRMDEGTSRMDMYGRREELPLFATLDSDWV